MANFKLCELALIHKREEKELKEMVIRRSHVKKDKPKK